MLFFSLMWKPFLNTWKMAPTKDDFFVFHQATIYFFSSSRMHDVLPCEDRDNFQPDYSPSSTDPFSPRCLYSIRSSLYSTPYMNSIIMAKLRMSGP